VPAIAARQEASTKPDQRDRHDQPVQCAKQWQKRRDGKEEATRSGDGKNVQHVSIWIRQPPVASKIATVVHEACFDITTNKTYVVSVHETSGGMNVGGLSRGQTAKRDKIMLNLCSSARPPLFEPGPR
jgi:hypothetical protein